MRRNALIVSLSPGQAHNGTEGHKLLQRLGPEQKPDVSANGPGLPRQPDPPNGPGPGLYPSGSTPPRHRLVQWEYDRELYKRRNEVGRLFRRLKGFRRVFTRYEKLDVIYLGIILFALICDALR